MNPIVFILLRHVKDLDTRITSQKIINIFCVSQIQITDNVIEFCFSTCDTWYRISDKDDMGIFQSAIKNHLK